MTDNLNVAHDDATTTRYQQLTILLHEAGMALLQCDMAGGIVPLLQSRGESGSCSWNELFLKVLLKATLFKRGVAVAARVWSDQEQPTPIEVLTGLWCIPLPIVNRRRRAGYTIAVLPTEELLESEQLATICNTLIMSGGHEMIGMDFELCRQLLRGVPPASSEDVPRIAALVRQLHGNYDQMCADARAVESMGRHLAESYEELNLLLTITQSMIVQERPERFIALACKEMLATLPYAWIGLQIADGSEARMRLRAMAGRMIVAGQPVHAVATLRTIARELLDSVNPVLPIVLNPASNPKHARYAALGSTVLVHPVAGVRSNEIIGLLIAGEKQGPDSAASNTDIKLLGAMATHVAIFLENAALYDDLNVMFLGTLEALTASIDAKDPYTCGHSRRVAHLTQQLAKCMKLDDHAVSRCHIAGLVHDVGKIGVPESVLTKPGRLTAEEFGWIRKHPEIGHRILKDIPQLSDILPGVLHHHERWDGRGYPMGLSGEEIPLIARFIGLADSFDAMSSTRTYRSAMSRQEVLAEITRCIGTQFDPDAAQMFVTMDFSEYDRMVREASRAHDDLSIAHANPIRKEAA